MYYYMDCLKMIRTRADGYRALCAAVIERALIDCAESPLYNDGAAKFLASDECASLMDFSPVEYSAQVAKCVGGANARKRKTASSRRRYPSGYGEDYIREHCGMMTSVEIGRKIGMSAASVDMRIRKMGLKPYRLTSGERSEMMKSWLCAARLDKERRMR